MGEDDQYYPYLHACRIAITRRETMDVHNNVGSLCIGACAIFFCITVCRTKIEMLKEQFRKLSKPADVDTDPATKDLSDKEKGMLKNFLLHINYATDKPSEKDKDTIVEAYYERKSIIITNIRTNFFWSETCPLKFLFFLFNKANEF